MVFYIHSTGHNLAWATHPEMLSFLPSNVTRMLEPENLMNQGGAVIVYNTFEFQQHVLQWALRCSLIQECIAPSYQLAPLSWVGGNDIHYCNASVHRFTPYNCHRYDQSMWNILVYNLYDWDRSKFQTLPMDWLGNAKRIG